MMDTKYKTFEDMVDKLQSLKGQTKRKFYQNRSDYSDQLNYRRQSKTFHSKEVPFSENAQSIARIMHKTLF